jgi:hypothetical protein
MFGIESATLTLVLAGAAGAVAWIILSHGWGWVLAKVETFVANEKATVLANIALATQSDLITRISTAEANITAIKTKLGI